MMEFRNLKASMMHNSGEKASIYMAISLVRSLFKDITEEAGSDELSNVPIGNGDNDERLPTEMIWISNQILKIYNSKSDELVSNKGRLDTAIRNLNAAQAELKELSDISEQLSRIRLEYNDFTARLDSSRKKKSEYDRISKLCESYREELEKLKGFEPEKKKTELSELEKKVYSIKESVKVIKQRLDAEQQEYNEVKNEYENTQKEYEILLADKKNYVEQQKELSIKIDQMNEEIEKLKKGKSSADDRYRYLESERTEYKKKLDGLNQEIDEYKAKYLSPLYDEYKDREREKKNLDEQKADVQSRIDELNVKKTELVHELASIRDKISDHEEAIEKKNAEISEESIKLKQIEKQHSDLKEVMDEMSERLDTIQTETMTIEKEKSPELCKNLCLELKRALKSIESMGSELNSKYGLYESDIDILNQNIEEADREVKQLKDKYDDLTRRYNNYNDKIKELNQQIADLEGMDTENRHDTYKKQLEQRIFDLEEKNRECNRIEKEIKEKDQKITELQGKLAELKNLKEQKESALSEKKMIEEEMLGMDSDYLKGEIQKLLMRTRMLEKIKGRLLTGIDELENALGQEDASDKKDELSRFSDILPKLRQNLESIQNEMVNLADAVRIGE